MRRALAALLLLWGLAAPACAGQANVFVYHRFDDSRYPSTNISSGDFTAQLELLRREQFTVLSLGEIVERLRSGRSLPERCAAITIDDAYRSFKLNGWPLLRRFGFPATLFVSTDSVGAGDFLSWDELTQLRDEGVEIGSHSAAHDYLLDRHAGEADAAWAARVREDLRRAEAAFRERLGFVPLLFAYPYGEFSAPLAGLVREAGYVAAFGQQSGVITAGQELLTLPRFPVGGGFAGLDGFRSKLFMRHLEVEVASPGDTTVRDAEPFVLRFRVTGKGVDPATLRCFAPGESDCRLRAAADGGGIYEAVALNPLAGRRGKYTLTASDGRGRWSWFSWLWVRPEGGDLAGQPGAR